MVHINRYSHIPFLTSELRQLLPDGSFASRMWRAIGNELHSTLVDDPHSADDGYSESFPIEALFAWTMKDGGLDPEWLSDKGGIYIDDDGEVIPSTVKPAYSAVEQLAAYGLWLLEEELFGYGEIPSDDADIGPLAEYNSHGFKRDEVIEHRAACMLIAYQALAYAHRILRGGISLSPEETSMVEKFDFSAMGRAGAEKRHAPMTALRSWAVERYEAGEWQSANQAAHTLKDSVIKHGRTINAHLTEANAQRTIAEWFRKSA
jgi:hypothetical protein